LDAEYRPLGHPDADAHPPLYPSRLRYFLYGCGLMAMENESKLAGGRTQRRALGG
jgi:hypothetical protein